jgi:hypothetical protein
LTIPIRLATSRPSVVVYASSRVNFTVVVRYRYSQLCASTATVEPSTASNETVSTTARSLSAALPIAGT